VLLLKGQNAVFLVQGRGEMAVMSTVTAVLLRRCAMASGTECSVVNTG